MKRFIAIILAAVLVLAFAGCGDKTGGTNTTPQNSAPQNSAPQNSAPQNSAQPANTANSAGNTANTPSQQTPSGGIAAAKDGTLTVSKADIAIVVKGTSVPMPYSLKALEAAGVPADASRSEIKLKAGDFFSANLYLDEKEDYLVIPAYYNGGSSEISITEAQAEEIMITTYADEPKDQGVSIFGVSFGMAKSDVKALLGEPSSDDGDYLEWHVEIPDMKYEGTLSMYFTGNSDSAGASQVDLTVFAK